MMLSCTPNSTDMNSSSNEEHNMVTKYGVGGVINTSITTPRIFNKSNTTHVNETPIFGATKMNTTGSNSSSNEESARRLMLPPGQRTPIGGSMNILKSDYNGNETAKDFDDSSRTREINDRTSTTTAVDKSSVTPGDLLRRKHSLRKAGLYSVPSSTLGTKKSLKLSNNSTYSHQLKRLHFDADVESPIHQKNNEAVIQ